MRGKQALKNISRNTGQFVKHNAPMLLTVASAAGVVATAVTTANATTKYSRVMAEAIVLKGEELTMDEKFRIAAPIYVPPVMFGVATITCLAFACAIGKKQQASLVGAYTMLDRSFKTYKDKVTELYGEDANAQVTDAIAKDNYPRQ